MGAVTPRNMWVTLQWNKSDCILLYLVGLLFNMNYDARNHELKMKVSKLIWWVMPSENKLLIHCPRVLSFEFIITLYLHARLSNGFVRICFVTRIDKRWSGWLPELADGWVGGQIRIWVGGCLCGWMFMWVGRQTVLKGKWMFIMDEWMLRWRRIYEKGILEWTNGWVNRSSEDSVVRWADKRAVFCCDVLKICSLNYACRNNV